MGDPYYVEILDSAGNVLMAMSPGGYVSGPMVEWVPGPAEKTYTARNTLEMFACHSVVGEERDFQDGIPNRFLSMEKDASGRFTPNAAASCQTVLRKFDTHFTGYATLIQMYVPTQSTWTSGSGEANTRALSMELEGGGYLPGGVPNFREPMNQLQLRTFLLYAVLTERWIAKRTNNPDFIWVPGRNMLPHHELVRRFGGGATACESGRYLEGWHRLPAFREDLKMVDSQARMDAQAAKAAADTLNDVLVVQRDLARAINAPHPHAWRIHHVLMGAGLLVDPEYAKENPHK